MATRKKKSNWDKKPSLHPERKGELNKSPLKNWVEKKGGLPTYINSVATALKRDKGYTTERAIRTAVNWAKKVCATGTTMGGRVKVSSAVQAAACAAVKKWESMKGSARVSLTNRDDKLSDEDFYALFQLDWNAWSGDDEEQSLIDLCDQVHEDSAIDLTDEQETDEMGDVLQLPVDATEREKIGRKLWRKQILPIGKSINYNGQRLDFTQELAESLIQNFNEGAFETVPLVLSTNDNKHTENPEAQRGEIVALELSADGTGLDAFVETDPRGSEIIENNPKMGISPRIFTAYTRASDSKSFGPVLRHGAMTLDPANYGLKEWEGVDLSADHGTEVIDLSTVSYEGGETVEDQERTGAAAGAESGAGEAAAAAESTEVVDLTNKVNEAVDLANRAIRERNELEEKLFRGEQEQRLERLATDGVPKSLIDLARPLVMQRGEGRVIDLTAESGETVQKPVADQVFELLEAAGRVPMGEGGRVDLTAQAGDDQDAALEFLREQFGN